MTCKNIRPQEIIMYAIDNVWDAVDNQRVMTYQVRGSLGSGNPSQLSGVATYLFCCPLCEYQVALAVRKAKNGNSNTASGTLNKQFLSKW